MGQAIIVYKSPDIVITIDSDDYSEMSREEIDEIIKETLALQETGESDFFDRIEEGPNPTPVYRH